MIVRRRKRVRLAIVAVGGVVSGMFWLWTRAAPLHDVPLLPPSPEDENHWGPSWSPDGRTIAFSAATDGDFEIYLLDVATGAVTQITDNEVADWRPDWSPDGESIVFSSERGGNLDIWIMDRAGENARSLPLSGGSENRVRFSPDGSRLAFDSDRSGSWGVFIVDADGTNQRAVVDSAGFDGYPAWSPDGERLVFTSNLHDPSGGSAAHELYTVRPDGSELLRLTYSPGNDQAADWSPDGDRIVFFSDRDGNPEIYSIGRDGSGERRLTDHDEWDFMPAWSPDGSRLAFDSRRDGRRAIWTMSARGGDVRRATHPERSTFVAIASDSTGAALQRLWASVADDPDVEYFAPEELFYIGRRLVDDGRVDDGVALLRAVVSVDPEHQLGWVVLAETYARVGRLDDARQAFGSALALDDDDERAADGLRSLERRTDPSPP